jgi:multidrug resistance efflux pump
MRLAWFVPALAIVTLVSAVAAQSPAQALHLTNCLVTPIHEVRVPAREAGVLSSVVVREGAEVQQGSLMARIDDELAAIELRVVTLQAAKAKEEAASDAAAELAQLVAEVAEGERRDAQTINRNVPGAMAASEVRRRDLSHEKAISDLQQAQMQQRVAVLERDAKAAEQQLAEARFQHRRLTAPVDGVVVGLFKQPGEWVNPGDTVVHVIGMSRLYVEGYMKVDEFATDELHERRVRIVVELERGRMEELPGTVVFCSPVVDVRQFRVRVEVENRRHNGQWLLRPGMDVEVFDAR